MRGSSTTKSGQCIVIAEDTTEVLKMQSQFWLNGNHMLCLELLNTLTDVVSIIMATYWNQNVYKQSESQDSTPLQP